MLATAWESVAYRPGHKGPLVRQAVLLPVWRWETDHEHGAGTATAYFLTVVTQRGTDGAGLCPVPRLNIFSNSGEQVLQVVVVPA